MIEFLDYTSKKIKIYVNEEKKIVVTIIEMYVTVPGDEPALFKKFIGKAKCMDEDKFDTQIGIKLSKDRAWIKYNEFCIKIIHREIDETDDMMSVLNGKVRECDNYILSKEKEIHEIMK